MNLDLIIEKLEFHENIKREVKEALNKEIESIDIKAEEAFDKENDTYKICNENPFTRLLIIIYLLERTYYIYKLRSIPDDIIIESFKDISLIANANYKKTGEIGLSCDDADWLSHIIFAEIFKIGSMQFEITKMFYIEKFQDGRPKLVYPKEVTDVLTKDTYVINCHLQEGGDLSGKATDKSFKLAREFFNKYYHDVEFKAFIGYTWLFYPKMVEHLPETSRIKEHAKRFKVYASCPCDILAVERLFPHGKDNNGKQYTSLQKMAVEHPDWFGFSFGVIWW